MATRLRYTFAYFRVRPYTFGAALTNLSSYMIGHLAIHGRPCSTFCFINSPHQHTPLHLAALGGRVDTVRCLVDKGADTSIKDGSGVSE